MKKAVIIIAVLMALAIAMSISSCGNIAEKVTEKAIEKTMENAAGSDAEIDIEDEGIKVSNDEGEVMMGEDTKLPGDWPSEVPAYPDIKITLSSKSKDDNGTDNFGLFAEVTKGTVKDVYEWHKDKMSGWEITSDNYGTTDGNDSFSIVFKNNRYEVLLMAGSDGEIITYTMAIDEPVTE